MCPQEPRPRPAQQNGAKRGGERDLGDYSLFPLIAVFQGIGASCAVAIHCCRWVRCVHKCTQALRPKSLPHPCEWSVWAELVAFIALNEEKKTCAKCHTSTRLLVTRVPFNGKKMMRCKYERAHSTKEPLGAKRTNLEPVQTTILARVQPGSQKNAPKTNH